MFPGVAGSGTWVLKNVVGWPQHWWEVGLVGDVTLKTGERLPLLKQVALRLRPLPLSFLKVRTVVNLLVFSLSC